MRPWSLRKLKALAASSHRTLHADKSEAQKRGAILAEAPDPEHHQGWDRYYTGAAKNTSGTQVIHGGALSVLSRPVLSTGAKPHPAKGTGTRGLPPKASHQDQRECRPRGGNLEWVRRLWASVKASDGTKGYRLFQWPSSRKFSQKLWPVRILEKLGLNGMNNVKRTWIWVVQAGAIMDAAHAYPHLSPGWHVYLPAALGFGC